MKITSAYIDTLTPLRGIAALWVVLFHFDSLLRFMRYAPLLSTQDSGLLAQGYLWVDFFFILSGFVIAHVYGGAFRGGVTRATLAWYAAARFARIYPLHLFSLAMHVLLFVSLRALWPALADWALTLYPNYPLADLLPNLLLLHSMHMTSTFSWNIPSWSIAAEWWTYLAFVPLFPLLQNKTGRPLLLAAALAFGALALLVLLSPLRSLDISWDYGFIRCFAGFTLGVVLYQLYQAGWGANWLGRDLSTLAALLAVPLAFHRQLSDLLMIPLFCWLALSAAYNTGRLRRIARSRVLRWLGDISYAIYMTHVFWMVVLWFGVCAYQEFSSRADPGLAAKLLALLAVLVLVLATSTLVYRYIEIPARDWLRRRLGQATRPLAAAPRG